MFYASLQSMELRTTSVTHCWQVAFSMKLNRDFTVPIHIFTVRHIEMSLSVYVSMCTIHIKLILCMCVCFCCNNDTTCEGLHICVSVFVKLLWMCQGRILSHHWLHGASPIPRGPRPSQLQLQCCPGLGYSLHLCASAMPSNPWKAFFLP